MALGCIDVTLNLDERDGSACEQPVRAEDRVAGVLPALVREPLFTVARIFDEAIAIEVAVAVDPTALRPEIP